MSVSRITAAVFATAMFLTACGPTADTNAPADTPSVEALEPGQLADDGATTAVPADAIRKADADRPVEISGLVEALNAAGAAIIDEQVVDEATALAFYTTAWRAASSAGLQLRSELTDADIAAGHSSSIPQFSRMINATLSGARFCVLDVKFLPADALDAAELAGRNRITPYYTAVEGSCNPFRGGLGQL